MARGGRTRYGVNALVRQILFDDGCWKWLGCYSKEGYPAASLHGIRGSAHSLAFKLCRGPIAEGHELHHTCWHRWCCRPDHLVPVTHKEHKRLHRLAAQEAQDASDH